MNQDSGSPLGFDADSRRVLSGVAAPKTAVSPAAAAAALGPLQAASPAFGWTLRAVLRDAFLRAISGHPPARNKCWEPVSGFMRLW